MMLAAETSSSSRVSTSKFDDTNQPRPIRHSSEEQDRDERRYVQSISCDGNEVSKNAVQHEVMNSSNDAEDNLSIEANSQSTCETQPAGDSTVFTECSDEENRGMTHSISESGDVSDKLACDGRVAQSGDQSLQSDTRDDVGDMSDVYFDRTNQSSNCGDHIDQTNLPHDLNGETLSPVNHDTLTTQPAGMVSQGPVDDTDPSAICSGQSLHVFDQTDRSTDHDGQKPCHVEQVVMLTKLRGRSVTEVRPANQTDHCDGQGPDKLCPVDQTDHPTYDDGQMLCLAGQMDQTDDDHDVDKQ